MLVITSRLVAWGWQNDEKDPLVSQLGWISCFESIKKRSFAVGFCVVSTVMVMGLPAYAQSSTPQSSNKAVIVPTEGLNLNLPASTPDFSSFNTDFSTNLLDLPAEAIGSTLFKLDIADPACLTGGGICLRRDDTLDFGYSKAFSARSLVGLDLTLTPRASLRYNDNGSSALVGAVVEIGENLRKGSELDNNTWYFFAGADAEALTYSPNSVSRLTSGQFHLQDRIIVGDAQAGLGYRIGDTDISLSYLRREATAEDFSFKEDAAALSFTWKR